MSAVKLTADSGGGTVSWKGPSSTTSNANVELTLPVDDGTANQVLKTDGSGNLAWIAPAAILQVVYIQKADTFTSSSASWVDVTGFTADITMTSSSNKVLVTCHVAGFNDDTTGSGIALDRGGSFIGLPSGYGSRLAVSGAEWYEERQDSYRVHSFTFLDTPGSGTHTYKVRAMPKGNALYINRSAADTDNLSYTRGTSDMTLMEVVA